MAKKSKKSEFLELLKINDNLQIRKWLVENGKAGKPYAAVMFEKEKIEEANKDEGDV